MRSRLPFIAALIVAMLSLSACAGRNPAAGAGTDPQREAPERGGGDRGGGGMM
jgi:predicted small secreted protein